MEDDDSTVKCEKPNNLGTNQWVHFVFDGPAVYPEYLSDVNVLVCPSDTDAADVASGRWNVQRNPDNPINPCRIDYASYMYFGWALMPIHFLAPGNTDVNAVGVDALDPNFLADMVGVIAASGWTPSKYEGDVTLSSQKTVYRLREGIERFFITDINNPAASAQAQSEIFVMSDDTSSDFAGNFNHVPGGGNCLYMDGHVEFIKYPGETPFSLYWASFITFALGSI
jgi:prepilin-type processing-associated H-X9-DG protein